MTERPLVVKTEVSIDAPASSVWRVLTSLPALGEWDDLPDEYDGDALALGSELLWRRMDGGYTKLTVTAFEPPRRLRLALYGSTWPLPPSAYDVGYTYSLTELGRRTTLVIEIGDFADLAHGEDFYEASLDFGHRASSRIRELAESGFGERPSRSLGEVTASGRINQRTRPGASYLK